MRVVGFLLLLVAYSEANSLPLNPMRAMKCVIPNGLEHVARAAFLQQCISKNYGQGNETRCYDELGCFPMDHPWTSLLRPFPNPLHPAEINTMLQCYTREAPEKMHSVILWPKIELNGCPFKAERKTAFITHGFASTGNLSWLGEFKDRYLEQEDVNLFVVDWGFGSALLNYLQVSSNTRIVGAEVARFIKYLQEHHELAAKKLHLIGHSLGAQISSYIAKRVPGVGRLTALDPAQPGFEGTDSTVRLDRSDAEFVEVVHTNAAPFIPALGYGMMMPHGHVDFYINGGMHQPGCMKLATQPEIKNIADLANFPVEVVSQWVCCSHCRSYEIYMRVLQPNCIIWGRLASFSENMMNAASVGITEKLVLSKLNKCTAQTCLPLRLDTPTFTARGIFAATATIKEPFCETNPEKNAKLLDEIKANKDDPALKDLLPTPPELPVLDNVKDSLPNLPGVDNLKPKIPKPSLGIPGLSKKPLVVEL